MHKSTTPNLRKRVHIVEAFSKDIDMSFEQHKCDTYLHMERGKVAEVSMQSGELLNTWWNSSSIHAWVCKCVRSSEVHTR